MKNVKEESTLKVKNRVRFIFVIVVIVAIVLYALYNVYRLISNPTNTFLVETGKVSLEEEATGYIIREEKVLKGNNYKNGMVPIKTEGERAALDEQIFRYYSKGEDELIKKIQNLDEEIQEVIAKESNSLDADIRVLDKEIELKLDEIAKNNNIQKITEYKKDISKFINKKAEIAGDKSPAGSHLNKLIQQRKEYEKQLNSGSEYVTADRSGMVSYRVDGLEEVLTPDRFSVLTEDFLNDLNLKTGQIVATNDECGKMVNNFECYVATIIENTKRHDAKLEDTMKIRLSNSEEVPAEIVYMQEQDEKVLIVFKVTKGVENLLNYRKISFDIIFWDFEGLKVPNTAIIEENDLQYVERNRAGYINKVLVKIKRKNDTYSIVDTYSTKELKELGFSADEIRNMASVNLYDEVVANPKNDE